MVSRIVVITVFSITLLMLVSGCGRSPTPSFYTLEEIHVAVSPPGLELPANNLGVRQVVLPNVLKRSQLVLIDNEQVEPLELHRWSEPLDAAMLRIVASGLRSRLDSSTILAYPWPKQFDPAQTLTINVTRFNGLPGKDVELSGVWTLSSVDGQEPLRTERFHLMSSVEGNDYSALVRAHSAALDQFINQLAESLLTVKSDQ